MFPILYDVTLFLTYFLAPTAPPQSVSATAISSQIISVKWNLPPYEHRHGMINGYKVIYTEVTTSKKFSTVVTSVHYAELTKLKKYTVYEISVLAFTGGGDGKLSDPIMERTAEDGNHIYMFTFNSSRA